MADTEEVELDLEGKKSNEETKEETEDHDEEIEALKRRVKEMEEEDAKLKQMHEELDQTQDSVNKEEVDARSIYVGNVDYTTKPEELQQEFHSCGTINRVTIVCDKWTGHPKGYAYVEFADKDSVSNALLMNEALFKGRQLKVMAKRTNVPGMKQGPARGNRGTYRPYFAPRGRFRSRRAYYHPYM